MLISLQYSALYRIGSKYEYIMSVCMTWGKFLFDLVNKRGPSRVHKKKKNKLLQEQAEIVVFGVKVRT